MNHTTKTPETVSTSPDPVTVRLRSGIVRKKARGLGFTAVGIVEGSALDLPKNTLKNWLSEGRHGTMDYLARFFERHDQFRSQIIPRSLIVVAAAYDPCTGTPEQSSRSMGKIARYAVGRNYHRILEKRLRELEKILPTLSSDPVQSRCCVDTAPIHERSLAQAAGLGFIGKNTCLIIPKGGSWVVLGAIATDLELEPDRAIASDCGECTRCLEACPTGALTAPYEMDANRCISYLTLEHRGEIPKSLRRKMGGWIAGCDICQEVCPYNTKPHEPWEELKKGAGKGQGIPLREILEIPDEEAFRRQFSGTALLRPKYQGMLRNAAIAAGNSNDTSLKPTLEARKNDPDPVIREAVRWAHEALGE